MATNSRYQYNKPSHNYINGSTDAARLRQKTQRLEIPDKPVSTSTVVSVEAACASFLRAEDDIK